MALWQYSFFVVPKCGEKQLSQVVQKSSCDDGFDDSSIWRTRHIPCNYFAEVDNILPRQNSWSKKIIQFGDEDSNCLEVFCEDGIVISAFLRIDFQTQYEFVLRELTEFFIRNELAILDEDLSLLPLNFETISSRIQTSPQVTKYEELTDDRSETTP